MMNFVCKIICCVLVLSTGIAQAQPQKSEANHAPVIIQGALGFRSFYILSNQDAWKDFIKNTSQLKKGVFRVGLKDPLQVVVLQNSWHLPSINDTSDIRLKDLKKTVLFDSVEFTDMKPQYEHPGYIVIVQASNKEWILIARLSNGFLIEDKNGIGLCRTHP